MNTVLEAVGFLVAFVLGGGLGILAAYLGVVMIARSASRLST